jgi:hypothetical protein
MADLTKIAAVLHQAEETHGIVYAIINGDHDDWASWYANWLIDLSELPRLLGVRPVPSELIYVLVLADKDYRAQQIAEPWKDVYAARIAEHFTPAT